MTFVENHDTDLNDPIVSNKLLAYAYIRNRLYFTKGEYKPNPSKSAAWNTGAYIVEGLGHCGMCHTPKTMLGGDEPDHALQGYVLQGWFAPDITNDPRRGLGGWSIDDIVSYLKTGHNRFAGASGPMGEEITQSTAFATDADLRAIAIYLKDRPGRATPKADTVSLDRPDMQAGSAIYTDLCSACHTPIAPAMPSFAADLNDTQVAVLVTYIRNAWATRPTRSRPSKVTKQRASLAQRASQ